MIVFDNHMHLRRDGMYIEAIKEFKKYGGTHLNFCPYTDYRRVIKENSYMECYEDGIKLAEEAMEKTGVKIFLTVGPYPVDYVKMKEIVGREKAMMLMKKGMEEAQKLCMEGRAIAIGEIGRPHFKVDGPTWKESNEIMKYGMELARDADVPVILHMEGVNENNMKEIAEMADDAGLDRGKVIKHFSPPIVKREENHGIFPSVISKKGNVEEAFSKGRRFMLETDYLDDTRRPGAVLALKTVPRRLNALLATEKINEEDIYKICKENPEKMYGITLEE